MNLTPLPTTLNANGIDIAYQLQGNPDGPVVCMIQGLGMPLTGWPPQFCQFFVDAGYRLLVFDNRDIGRSQLMHEAGKPRLLRQRLRQLVGLPIRAPYQLEDMARDAIALLDGLKIDSAHVLGVSMGGMIAQLVAIQAPQKVRSLVSLMSTTGNPDLPGPDRKVIRHLLFAPRGRSLDQRVAHNVKTWQLIGSPAWPTPRDEIEAFVRKNFARGITAAGLGRQMLAIGAAPSRVAQLQKVAIPSLVIHGNADPLVSVQGGYDTALALPTARLEVIPGLGHNLPTPVLDRICRLIREHISATDDRRADRTPVSI